LSGVFFIARQRMTRPTGQPGYTLKLFGSNRQLEEIVQINGKSLSAGKMPIYRGLAKLKQVMRN